MGADVVSEVTIEVIRQFHPGIAARAARSPSPHCHSLRAAEHDKGNRLLILIHGKPFLIRPLHSLAQCAQGIELEKL